MQAAGLIVGPVLAAILLATGMSHDLDLAPPARLRRRPGAWRCSRCAGTWRKRRATCSPTGTMTSSTKPATRCSAPRRRRARSKTRRRRRRRPSPRASGSSSRAASLALRLIGASVAWFLMDFAYYGNTVSSPMVLAAIQPDESAVLARHHAARRVRGRRRARLFRRRLDDGQAGAQDHPDPRLPDDGARLRRHGHRARHREDRRPVPGHLRGQLLLHRVRPQRDDLRLSGRAVPGGRRGPPATASPPRRASSAASSACSCSRSS